MVLSGEDSSATQSSSIGAVRWNLPTHDESSQPHSSVPSRPTNSLNKQSQVNHILQTAFLFSWSVSVWPICDHLCLLQQQTRQNGLKDLRSLQECVQFIQQWKEQVDQVCKVETGRLLV